MYSESHCETDRKWELKQHSGDKLCRELLEWLSLLPVSHQVIRNFELMGRVDLDQLELIKDQVSSGEEDEEHEMMEMGLDGKEASAEDEEEEEEEEEYEEEEGIEMMRSLEQQGGEMDVEEGGDSVREEEEEEAALAEEEEEDEGEVQEMEEERHAPKGKCKL